MGMEPQGKSRNSTAIVRVPVIGILTETLTAMTKLSLSEPEALNFWGSAGSKEICYKGMIFPYSLFTTGK